jgi:hypothetical membrane protein
VNGLRDRFVYAGLAAPAVFWATLFICGLRYEGYSHMSNLVSELGSTTAPTRYWFTFGLVMCSLLSLLFVVGLVGKIRRRRDNRAPAFILLTFTFSIAGTGIFPMENTLHGILGMPSALLLLSPILALVFWKDLPFLPRLGFFAFLSLAAFLPGFLVFAEGFLVDQFGLKQRFFHIGWTIWFVYLSLGFSGRLGWNNRP